MTWTLRALSEKYYVTRLYRPLGRAREKQAGIEAQPDGSVRSQFSGSRESGAAVSALHSSAFPAKHAN